MDNLTETLLKFPCDFSLKVMGKNNESFEKIVYNTVCKHVAQLADNAIRTHLSKKNTYMSITITFEAVSKAQLDQIYEDLSAHNEVIMVL